MTNKLEILPCPFCGSEKCSPNYHSARVWVDCDSCGVRGQTVSSKWIDEERGPSIEEAIVLWNKRAAPVVERQEPVTYKQHAAVIGYARKEDLAPLLDEAQPDGSHIYIGIDHPTCWADEPPYEHLVPLYAEQPAPVAVVLDDNELIEIARKAAVESPQRYNYMPHAEDAATWLPHRWVIDAMRACLDKVKELDQ